MEEKENIVLYDWLSFTSKNHTPEQLIEALGLTHCPWQDTKGAHGYRDRKYFSCISVHYNGREDMGVWVELSGQGCRTFESLSAKSWDDLFQWITVQQLKITRLDVAFDDHTGVLDIDQIVEDTRRKHLNASPMLRGILLYCMARSSRSCISTRTQWVPGSQCRSAALS